MNLNRLSRSVMLWLIAVTLAFSAAKAQEVTNNYDKNKIETNQTSQTPHSLQTISKLTPEDKIKLFSKYTSDKEEILKKPQPTTTSSNKEWGFYAGSFTFHKDISGESQKAPVFITGIRHAWSLKNNDKRRLRYYMDFNPLIIVNYRQKKLVSLIPETYTGERKTVFGVGFTPLGIQHNWRNTKKYQPFIAGGIGVAIFNKKFPDNRSVLEPDEIGNRFQVMPEFGAGLEIRQSERKSYFIGYKYHHMSNAYTAPLNVGYNTNMIYGGVYLQRGN